MGEHRTVITGLGVVSPNGADEAAFAAALREGKSGVERIAGLDLAHFKTHVAGLVHDEDVAAFANDEFGDHLDRTTRLALAAAGMAHASSGLAGIDDPSLKQGVAVGSACGPVHSIEAFYRQFFVEKTPYACPSSSAGMQPHSVASEVALRLGATHSVQAVSASSASGLAALATARQAILAGESQAVLVGGVDAPVAQYYYRTWDSLRLMTRDFNQAPETASRPFDERRTGMVLSEGAAFVVLERQDVAQARGATILGEVLGVGQSIAARDPGAPAPESLAACMRDALDSAGLTPAGVAHIQAHAASLPAGDLAEAQAIRDLFGSAASGIAVSSIKSMTGHALGASGILSLAAVLVGMREGFVPPSTNLDNPDDACAGLDLVANEPRKQAIPAALINDFGLGGANVSVVVAQA